MKYAFNGNIYYVALLSIIIQKPRLNLIIIGNKFSDYVMFYEL